MARRLLDHCVGRRLISIADPLLPGLLIDVYDAHVRTLQLRSCLGDRRVRGATIEEPDVLAYGVKESLRASRAEERSWRADDTQLLI
jgi:hypothetical protein